MDPKYRRVCPLGHVFSHIDGRAAANLRDDGTLTQADLDRAATYVGVLPKVDEVLRHRFLALVEHELAGAAAERGVALDDTLRDHVRCSLGRVAALRVISAPTS